MYTRPQNSNTGKILLQPNQPPRTEKPKSTPPQATNDPPQTTIDPSQTDIKAPSTDAENSPQPPAVPSEENGSEKKKPRYKAKRPTKQQKCTEQTAPDGDTADTPKTADDLTRDPPNKEFSSNYPPPKASPDPTHKKGGLGALLDGYTSDEILIFAIIILLIMQGSDDILVLALCYVIL